MGIPMKFLSLFAISFLISNVVTSRNNAGVFSPDGYEFGAKNGIPRLQCNLSQAVIDEIASYSDDVNTIIDYFITGNYKGKAYEYLQELTDSFGGRMTGSSGLSNAVFWVFSESLDDALESVAAEAFEIDTWERNGESLYLTNPRIQQLQVMSFWSSVGTPPEGLEAEVYVVTDFVELENNAAMAMGRIVVFDFNYTNYQNGLQYVETGATEAAKNGAVAVLVRSLTDFSMNTVHAGRVVYDEEVAAIPAASITLEDAAMLQRLQQAGETVKVLLTMGAESTNSSVSWNTVAEIRGSEEPEKVVVLSGHLDSWDKGVGAMDDGGGCMISWSAVRALKEMGFKPRRTFRSVLFTGHEQGSLGAETYYVEHIQEHENFQLLMESDTGTFEPLGIAFSGTEEAQCIMQEVLKLTAPLGDMQLYMPAQTSDLTIFEDDGIPVGSLYTDNPQFYWYQHSKGDRLDIFDSDTMDRCAALWTAVAYVTANMTIDLPR